MPDILTGGTDARWMIHRSGLWWHWETYLARDRMDGWCRSLAAAKAEAKEWARIIEGRRPHA